MRTGFTTLGCFVGYLLFGCAANANILPQLGRRAGCEDFATYSTRPEGRHRAGPRAPLHAPARRVPHIQQHRGRGRPRNIVPRMKDPDLARYTTRLTCPPRKCKRTLFQAVREHVPQHARHDYKVVRRQPRVRHHRGHPRGVAARLEQPVQGVSPACRRGREAAAAHAGVINLQARYITQYPYCNAFQPPPESGLPPQCCSGDTGAKISPPDNMNIVWTCGYELDSLLSFLQLSRTYYQYSQDRSIFTFNNSVWFSAVEAIMQVIEDQAVPTYDAAGNVISFYNISGPNQQYMKNDGRGPPKADTGLVGTTYRPSDDVVAFPYNIPHQAMAVVELRGLAALLQAVGMRPDLRSAAAARADTVEAALWRWGTVLTKDWGEVFAYEVDGYGGAAIQDDPNVPSLVSIPYLGFANNTNAIYANTRRMVLSPQGNPYYGFGPVIRGVSSPHVDEKHVWPMGLITEVVTGSDDADILVKLEYLKNTTTGLGLIHESVNTHNVADYTRPWFAWANSYFAETILQLAETKPHLLFADGKPFKVSDVLTNL
ncbi:hypothetical protein B0H10DRAFT_2441460 [Mycena sp. CBHHK59/15]|nr:hypothetical protein B0H10DRAFT_2441460 [Mycena sp. CBHHK59/15]